MVAYKTLAWAGILVFVLGMAAAAQAKGPAKHIRELKAALSEQINDLEDAKQGVEDSDGSLEAVDNYLWAALNVVNLAKTTANYDANGKVEETNDLVSLVGLGYLPYWPGNPLNDWEPMRVLQASDGFSAGDLCLMVCPPEAYGDMGAGPEAASYELFVYGPDESVVTFGTIYMAGTNGTWCTAPSGAMYGIGFYCMSVKEHEEQNKKIEEYKKNHPDWPGK